MKKTIHVTVLSAFLLASTHSMAAPTNAKYDDLRQASANMTKQQAKETEAGNPVAVGIGVAYLVWKIGSGVYDRYQESKKPKPSPNITIININNY